MWTVVLSLLFCQIQGKCLCKHRKVFTLLSSPKRLIKERGISQKMISAGEDSANTIDFSPNDASASNIFLYCSIRIQ